MNRFSLTSLLLCCCLFFTVAVPAEEKDAQLDEIFALSGIDETLQQIPLLINATFDNLASQEGNDPRVLAEMKDIMANVMSPDKLRGSTMEHLQASLSRKEIKKIHAQLKSPFAQRMSALEKEAGQPDSAENIMAFAQMLEKQPPTDQRINLITELVRASNAVESSLTMRTEFFRGFMEATSQLAPPDKRISSEQIDEKISSMRRQLLEPVAQEIILTYFYLYRSLSDSEIENYIAMYHEPEMAHFNDEMNIAMATAFRHAGNDLMQALTTAYGG